MIVVKSVAMQELVRCSIVAWAAWTTVERVSVRGESLGPKRRGHVGVEEKGANVVVEGAKNALGMAILLRCVRTSEPEDHAIRCKERSQRVVVKFLAIVSLQASDGATKLSTNISVKANES